jgi:hypothetical protein
VENRESSRVPNTTIGEEGMLVDLKEDDRINGEIPDTRCLKLDSTHEEEEKINIWGVSSSGI